MNAIATVIIGWATDRYELRRTWVISAGCLLLGGMMILEARHHNLALVGGSKRGLRPLRPLFHGEHTV